MPRDTGVFKIKEQVLVAYTDKHYEAKVRRALELDASCAVNIAALLKRRSYVLVWCGCR